MICEHDLQNLVSQWGNRIKQQEFDPAYCDAINDCIFDIKALINNVSQEEAEAMDPFANMTEEEFKACCEDLDADSFLMSEHYF